MDVATNVKILIAIARLQTAHDLMNEAVFCNLAGQSSMDETGNNPIFDAECFVDEATKYAEKAVNKLEGFLDKTMTN